MKKHVLLMLVCLTLALAPAGGGLSAAPQAFQMTGYINASGVRIRSGPGTDHDSFGTAGTGDVIRVVSMATAEDGTVWYYGQINGISGWVHSAYVSASAQAGPTAAPSRPAASFSTSFSGVVCVSSANMRLSADLNGAVVAVLDRGAQVTVLSGAMDTDGSLWYYCRSASGQTGYIRADLIAPGTSLPTYAPTALPVRSVSFTGYTNDNAVNVRDEPDGNRVDRLRRGTRVQVTGEVQVSSGKWYRVTWSGGTGYIRADLISRSNPAPTAAPTEYAFTETPLSFAGAVLKDNCNVRRQPSYGADVLFRVSAGETVQVFGLCSDGSGGLWYHVYAADGRSGYILAELVSSGTAGQSVLPGGDGAFSGVLPDAGISGLYDPSVIPDTGVSGLYDPSLVPDAGVQGGSVPTAVPENGIPWSAVPTPAPENGVPWSAVPTVTPEIGISWGDVPSSTPENGTVWGSVPSSTPENGAPWGSVPSPAPDGGVSGSPVPTAAPTDASTPHPFITSGPTVQPTPGEASAARTDNAAPLSFEAFACVPGQTLSVYSAPSVIAFRSDGGSASVTTTDNLWAAGYDGQWLLILYNTEGGGTRVGYVSALSLQGALPEAPALAFAAEEFVLSADTALTDDPMGGPGQGETLALKAGTHVTWLCDCYLGSAWSYVEIKVAGMPARGFVPFETLKR